MLSSSELELTQSRAVRTEEAQPCEGSVYHSGVLITEDYMVGETIMWN